MVETLKEPGLYWLAVQRALDEITPMGMSETLRDYLTRVGIRCCERFEDAVDAMNSIPAKGTSRE